MVAKLFKCAQLYVHSKIKLFFFFQQCVILMYFVYTEYYFIDILKRYSIKETAKYITLRRLVRYDFKKVLFKCSSQSIYSCYGSHTTQLTQSITQESVSYTGCQTVQMYLSEWAK